MHTVSSAPPGKGRGVSKAIKSAHPEPNVGRVFGVITFLMSVVFLVRSIAGGEVSRSLWFLLPGLLVTTLYWRRNLWLVVGLWVMVVGTLVYCW